MSKIKFGKTNLEFEKNGFGALPLQRISLDEAVKLLHHAFEGGMQFFDTARGYSNSEEKLGAAFVGMRKDVILATKTHAKNQVEFWEHLHTSLEFLQTDYIDLYQLHNPPFLPLPGGEDGLYDAMLKAKSQGLIRHMGITNHALAIAHEAVESGLYESLQFPFNYLSTKKEMELPSLCKDAGMGFIAMKAMSGGLFQNARAPFAFINQIENVVPIWGIQHQCELEEFLSFMQNPPAFDAELQAVVDSDRTALQGSFCRGCGYCMPCPVGIEINNAARISLLLRRAVPAEWITPEWQQKMNKILDCRHCNRCIRKCPYHLDTPSLLVKNYNDYQKYLQDEGII